MWKELNVYGHHVVWKLCLYFFWFSFRAPYHQSNQRMKRQVKIKKNIHFLPKLTNPPGVYARFTMVSHNSDVIMKVLVSQITGISVACSTLCSSADRQTPKLHITGLCEGDHQLPKIPLTKDQLRRECFHLMMSSWIKGLKKATEWWQILYPRRTLR